MKCIQIAKVHKSMAVFTLLLAYSPKANNSLHLVIKPLHAKC